MKPVDVYLDPRLIEMLASFLKKIGYINYFMD